jgi:hypothetical protein
LEGNFAAAIGAMLEERLCIPDVKPVLVDDVDKIIKGAKSDSLYWLIG